MENNVEVVFSVIIAIFLLFFFPMYIAFEKKDDISYFLTLRVTSDFVDKVKNTGYISKKDYDDYMNKLLSSGLVLNVKFEHKSHTFNPVIAEYSCDTSNNDVKIKELNNIYEYELNKNKDIFYKETSVVPTNNTINQMFFNDNITLNTEKDVLRTLQDDKKYPINESIDNNSYKMFNGDIFDNTNLYKTDEIGNIYTLNKGDEFNVVITNETVTIPEVFFNLLTVNSMEKRIPRVYVNYGGVVKNERYKEFDKIVDKVDKNIPVINNFDYSVTTNSIKIFNIDCEDNEGIVKYRYFIPGIWEKKATTETTATITGLKANTIYDVFVVVYDADGNSAQMLRKIRTLETKVSIPDLVYSYDSGINNSDNITNKSHVRIEGKGTIPNTKIRLRNISDGNFEVKTNTDSSGKWSIYIDLLKNSKNVLKAYMLNGSEWIESDKLTIICDDIAPTVPSVTYKSGSNTCSWKNNYSLVLSSTDNLSGIYNYEIDHDNNGTVDGTTTTVFVPKNGYNTHYDRYRAIDKAGNTSSWTGTNHIHMDTERPQFVKYEMGQKFSGKQSIYIYANDNLSRINRVYIETSTEDKGFNNKKAINAVWDSSKNAYRADIYISNFGNYNGNYRSNIYIYDNAGNGGLVENVGNGSSNIVSRIKEDLKMDRIKVKLSTGTEYTRENPTVTIIGFPYNSIKNEYSIDGEAWKEYTGSFTIDKNCIIYVRATDIDGAEKVITYKVTTIDKTSPTISNFTYTVTSNSIRVTNVNCYDNNGGSGIYRYRYSTSGKDSGMISNSSYTLSGLNPNTYYDVTVRVYDLVGNSITKTKRIRTLSTYTITYYANGGSGAPSSQTKVQGSAITLSSVVPTRANYKFVKWNTRSDGRGTDYYGGNNYYNDSSLTLYAIWKESAVPIKNKVKVGDYIAYNAGGYSSWRILYDGSEGYGVQIISEGSVKNVTIYGSKGYDNLIYNLNDYASSYLNGNYAISSRCVGSNPGNPSSYSRVRVESFSGNGIQTRENTQTHHTIDCEQMRKSSSLYNIGETYWLASRYVHGRFWGAIYTAGRCVNNYR